MNQTTDDNIAKQLSRSMTRNFKLIDALKNARVALSQNHLSIQDYTTAMKQIDAAIAGNDDNSV
jgi:hypothetical protein